MCVLSITLNASQVVNPEQMGGTPQPTQGVTHPVHVAPMSEMDTQLYVHTTPS